MEWINLFGLAFMLVILVPNIIFAAKSRGGFQNLWHNRLVEVLEQIGRFGCFILMVLIIPSCGFGFASGEAFVIYLLADAVLVAAYCLIWVICFRKNSIFRALTLSIIPSIVFLLSGALSQYWPLLVAALIFAPCHIAIIYKNAALEVKHEHNKKGE